LVDIPESSWVFCVASCANSIGFFISGSDTLFASGAVFTSAKGALFDGWYATLKATRTNTINPILITQVWRHNLPVADIARL